MVILLGVGMILLSAFIYSALVLAKRSDEYVYKEDDE